MVQFRLTYIIGCFVLCPGNAMQSELHVQEFMCLLNDNTIWMQVGYIMDNENDIKMSVILFQGNNVDMCNMKSF